jgi:conjugative transfer signal peptidase TraF
MSRRALLIGGALAVAGLLVPAVLPMPLGLVWNASASAPMGLYAIRPMRHPVRGVLAVIRPPMTLARFAAERRYLPLGVPLIKPVAATAHHTVCRAGLDITIDNRPVGHALAHDSHGRPLPSWQGCHVLSAGELFVMNAAVRDSFDGRYFGALPTSAVLGRARPLWTWPTSSQQSRSQDHDPDR